VVEVQRLARAVPRLDAAFDRLPRRISAKPTRAQPRRQRGYVVVRSRSRKVSASSPAFSDCLVYPRKAASDHRGAAKQAR